MKVALIHYRLLLRGGLETRLLNYINYFHSRGDEVTVIVAKHDTRIQLPPEVKVIRIDLDIIPKRARMFFFNRRLKKMELTKNFDFSLSLWRTGYQQLVLCPGTHFGFLKAIKKKIRTPWDYMEIYLDRLTFKKTPRILAASGMIRKELIQYYRVPDKKITVLFPPLDTSRFNPEARKSRKELRDGLKIPPDYFCFLFVSTSHRLKNLKLLISLFRELENEKTLLIVSGHPVTSTPNIISAGFEKNMERLYAAADVTLLPSRYDAFGQVVSESLACRTPVVVSSMTGAGEIIKNEEGIIMEDFDPVKWRETLLGLIHGKRKLVVEEDVALREGLSLNYHMGRMLKLVGR